MSSWNLEKLVHTRTLLLPWDRGLGGLRSRMVAKVMTMMMTTKKMNMMVMVMVMVMMMMMMMMMMMTMTVKVILTRTMSVLTMNARIDTL